MSEGRYNQLMIRTPEGVEFVYQLASPVARCLALFFDFGVIWGLMIVVSTVVGLLQWVSRDFASAFFVLLYFAISIGYFIVLELVWRGQTVGKRMFRLRVLDANGLKLKGSQLILRNLLRFVDGFPFLYTLGGIVAVLNAKSQRLGDLAAGTIVVRTSELEQPSLAALGEVRFNSFRQYPRLEALLRQRTPPEQAELALQALRRRDEMEASARVRLYRELADSFRELVAFPDEVGQALSDEQYLRNCVESIFRHAKS